MNYWAWFFCGAEGEPAGVRSLCDRWLGLHLIVGFAMARVVPLSLEDGANRVLLPLAGVLVGLCFAWGGNAQSLLQTDEILLMADHHRGGFRQYAFVYQTAVLILVTALVLWGIAGLGVFDHTWPCCDEGCRPKGLSYFGIKTGMYLVVSLAVRECWQVVLGTQYLAWARVQISAKRESAKASPLAGASGGVEARDPE